MEIKVLNKAFAILEFIAIRRDEPVLPGEILAALELSQPTCVRLLKVLTEQGYLTQVSRQRGYRLGPLAYFLGGGTIYEAELVAAARNELDDFAAATGQSVQLAIRHGGFRVILYARNADGGVKLDLERPRYRDLYLTATGRMLLAVAPPGEAARLLAATGVPDYPPWQPGATAADCLAELARIREAAIVSGFHHGRGSAATPVFGNGKAVAVLGCVWDEKALPDAAALLRKLMATARKISHEISGGGVVA